MPGKVKVKIISGRNLPVMDRSSDTTDAYVEIKLGSTTYKTDVCRKSLHPHWNSEWYRFEVDDSELQDEPLQIRLMDHDTYSANDAIGKVYLDLNPLLLPAASLIVRYSRNGDNKTEHPSVMSGWIPVYDTMHGIRGEVNIIVKVELFSDFNRFRQSSCGVQFFCSKTIPHGYFAQIIHGFVEELIVNDDPEYQWIDKIRTPRASNEARQTLFFKLSGELQRKIGVKALDLGGNAVIGYCQCFDLEGESGIVARGIGTAATLVKLSNTPHIAELNKERAQSYLKFLGSRASFHLSPTRRPHSPLIAPLPTLDIDSPRYKHLPKHLYKKELSQQLRSTRSSPTLNEQTHPSVQVLLKQEDMRGTPSYGLGQKLRNFKNTSQNVLSQKISALKAKLGDTGIEENEFSEAQSKRSNFKRAISDSSVMAELLARSVIHAHNSLTCILEAQDSGQDEDETVLGKTVSEPLLSLHETSSFESQSSDDEDDDDEEEESKEIELDTVSNIVKNVMLESGAKTYSKQMSLPALSYEDDELYSASPEDRHIYHENDYLERFKAPIVKIESDDETDDEDSLMEHRLDFEVEKTPPIKPKSIIPKVGFQSKGLFKTAMQTILLEKVNIMGTYTPPRIPRSATAVSLDGYKTETVLGAPFMSLRRQHSNPCLSENTNQVLSSEENINRNKMNFIHLLRGQSCIEDHNTQKRKFSLLKIKSPRFSFLHKKKTDDTLQKHGLVGTALGNVVMETVQDILATSKSDKPVPSPLTSTNNDASSKSDGGHNNMHASLPPSLRNTSPEHHEQTHHRAESVGTKLAQSPAKLNSVPCIYRRSSDSDLSITPKGNSLTGSDRSAGFTGKLKTTVPQENFDMLEYPFLTMSNYPAGFITHLGGAVSARSVKLLERISNLEEPESRDTWWSEIRMEIRSHARALNCNAVLGYTETTSICEDVCVLSASGTAAVIGFHSRTDKDPSTNLELEKSKKTESPEHDSSTHCSICHLPYNTNNVPIRSTVMKCASCRNGKVPDVLIATIEVPEGAPTVGRGCFIQSFVCRQLKDLRGESNAKEISDGLPFLEYELHRLLINKLKIKGMNGIFGLKIKISIGEKMLIGIAAGTAVFLSPLPAPVLPKLVSDRKSDEKKLADLQKLLHETVRKNREIYQLKQEESNGRFLSDDDSEDEQTSIDLSLGNKDCCVLEVDDPVDADVLKMLMEERPPEGFHVVNTEFVPGLDELEIVKNLQMFTQIYRAKFHPSHNFDVHFHRLLQSVYFKLRRMVPCALCDLQFRVDLPETDEIQLCVLGMALGLGDPQKIKIKKKNAAKRLEDDLIFNLEDDQIPEDSVANNTLQAHFSSRLRQKSPSRNRLQTVKQRHMPYKERHGVDITPLSYVPGGQIEQYLGNLNFFFIRETTSIREEGGLSGFIHSFVTEVLAIVRSHVTALGGNAMVGYFMTECVLNHNLHKNQGQCLINVGGDVVFVSYFKEDS